jgi:DNA-binding NtrC family response regulator/ligand-binding sensor domain-containing protein
LIRQVDFNTAVWRSHTTAQGLAGRQVEHVEQDHEGYLWFATSHSGVSRFDGESFHTFTRHDGLCGNQVMHILQDRAERLWFGTLDGGLCYRDGDGFHHIVDAVGERGMVMHLFEDRRGRLWYAGREALGYIEEGVARDLLADYVTCFGEPPKGCYGIAENDDGGIWLGTQCVAQYDGSTFSDGTADGALRFPGGAYFAVAPGADDTIWIGGAGEVIRRDGFDAHSVLAGDFVLTRKIRVDADGRVWLCTVGGGLYCVTGGELLPVEPNPGRRHAVITDVLRDAEGLFWFTTWGDGVRSCDPDHIQCLFPARPAAVDASLAKPVAEAHPEDRITFRVGSCRIQDDSRTGVLWVWHDGGLARQDGQSVDAIDSARSLRNITDMAVSGDGRLWLCGRQGLWCCDGHNVMTMGSPQGLPDGPVRSLAVDREGHLLLGHLGEGGKSLQVSRYEAGVCHLLFECERRFDGQFNRLCPTRDGGLWLSVGEWDSPIGRAANLGRLSAGGDVTWFGLPDGLVDGQITDLLQDRDGNLWVATWGGLSCFEGTTFVNHTTRDGLPVDSLMCLHQDRRGQLWLGTESGMIRRDGEHFRRVRDPGIDGPVEQIFDDGSDGLWLVVGSTVVRYRPARTNPRVRILGVSADCDHGPEEEVEVNASAGRITVSYQGMSFRTPRRDLLYRYRLQGHETTWQASMDGENTVYANVPPGDYSFQVLAIDRDLNESLPATVRIRVIPDPRLQALTRALDGTDATAGFVGDSVALQRVLAQLLQVARADLTVLLLGDTGTGKGLAARTVHRASDRRDGPFIQVNCGALPAALVESELFGHERGAFTGADARRLGKVELAQGGSLFLDEIGDLPLESQVKLLRLLEERTYERVGGAEVLTADARVIAATNRDLENMVADKRFRGDLYYRLRVLPVELPSLAERLDDVEVLALFFAERMAQHLSKPIAGITPAALAALQAYDWPGNIRELEHVIQRAVIVAACERLDVGDMVLPGAQSRHSELGSEMTPEAYERQYLQRGLERAEWIVKGKQGAAALLGMPESTLRSRMRRLGLRRRD